MSEEDDQPFDQHQQQQQQQPPSLAVSGSSETETEQHAYNDEHQNRPKSNSVDSADFSLDLGLESGDDMDDDDLKMAKEMAVLITQNPGLTPDQIRELMEKQQTKRKKKRSTIKKVGHKVKAGGKKVLKSVGLKSSSSGTSPKQRVHEEPASGGTTTAPRLGEWLETSERSSRFGGSEDDQEEPSRTSFAAVQPSPIHQRVRMTGIVWKRRSGLGKYSVSAAWERRRIKLQGSKLEYYRSGQDNDAHPQEEEEEAGWLESAFTTVATGTTTSKNSVARGVVDLVKENASVGASFGHSGSPTPFALSIKVLNQTKWKLCFDTHGELMQWLAAMTDAIVQGSVDVYNAHILQANDPTLTEPMLGQGQLSEPPLIARSGQKMASGHRLWVTGHYNVKSEDFPEATLEEARELQDSDEDEGDDDATTTSPRTSGGVQKKTPKTVKRSASSNMEFTVDPQSGKDVWTIPQDGLWQVIIVLNLTVVISRASSTTNESFWYLIVFTNLLLRLFLTKEKVGGTVSMGTNGQIITPEMARRLSHDTGMSVQPTHLRHTSSTVQPETPEIPQPSAKKPSAGQTTMRIANPTDLPVSSEGHVFAGWRLADPAIMAIRSHGYKATKKKVPSPGNLYQCAKVDIFEARSRYPDMASRVNLPQVSFANDPTPKTWNAPDTFVVSIAIPTDPPKLYSSSENGGGYTVTMYFTMTQETRDILKRVTADGYNPSSERTEDVQKSKVNAVRLFEEWCRRAPTDDSWMARFKVVPNAQNLKEIGLPSWISKYNGKPFLIKRPGQTGFLFRHPETSTFEFDISLHPFPYLAKQGICYMKESYFKKVLVTFGFLIEGRADDELPECLIGLMQLCYPDPVHAVQGEDFLAGNTIVSFKE